MKVEVRYFTQTGNTKKLADAIAGAIGCEARDLSAPLDGRVDLLFLGSSVYAAGVAQEVKDFLAANKEKIGAICSFSTAALLPSTYKQIGKIAAACGVTLLPEEFHCRGSFAFLHKGRPNEEDRKAAAEFALGVLKKAEQN